MGTNDGTPPFGVVALFREVKKDLREAVQTDKRDHDAMRLEMKGIRDDNKGQSEALARIESKLSERRAQVRLATEAGKNKRAWLSLLAPILLCFATAITTYYFSR